MPTSDKPTNLRRQESLRANGAKSHGPVTPEGKARSSRNARLANCITITEEEEAAFEDLRAQYEIEFAPRNQVQSDIVTQIAWGTMRLQLAWAEEASLIEGAAVDRSEPGRALDQTVAAPAEADALRRARARIAKMQERTHSHKRTPGIARNRRSAPPTKETRAHNRTNSRIRRSDSRSLPAIF